MNKVKSYRVQIVAGPATAVQLNFVQLYFIYLQIKEALDLKSKLGEYHLIDLLTKKLRSVGAIQCTGGYYPKPFI